MNMIEEEVDWDALASNLEDSILAANERYEQVVREFCLLVGITGGNADAVLDTGVVALNNIAVTMTPGTLSDPWTMQMILDLGPPEGGDLQAYYKSLLTMNKVMVGAGGLFAVDDDSGHGLLIAHMSMKDERFNAPELADYLAQLTSYYAENQSKTLSQAQFETGAIFG